MEMALKWHGDELSCGIMRMPLKWHGDELPGGAFVVSFEALRVSWVCALGGVMGILGVSWGCLWGALVVAWGALGSLAGGVGLAWGLLWGVIGTLCVIRVPWGS